MAANSELMEISHSRFSKFHVNKHEFLIHGLLLVFIAHQNLLFVHRFCIDNNVVMEFDEQTVRVLDWKSGKVLMVGSEVNGLY